MANWDMQNGLKLSVRRDANKMRVRISSDMNELGEMATL